MAPSRSGTVILVSGVREDREAVRALGDERRATAIFGEALTIALELDDVSNVAYALEGLARWTYEGRTGQGISEYLHQLDDDNRPLTPIE